MAADPARAAASDDEDQPDNDTEFMWQGKKAFIFLIDATDAMFEKKLDDKCFFMHCIESCKQVMLQKIFNQEKDLFGIVFYGVKRSGQGAQANHVFTLQDLAMCSADKIKELLTILEDVDGFAKQHGHSNDFSLAEVLWHCLMMVSKCTTRIYQKTIYLMTCNDNPHSVNTKLQHDTRTRAKDLREVDMLLEILAFGLNFNPERFYKEVCQIAHDDDDISTSHIKVVKSVDDVIACFDSSISKRSTSRVMWSLGEDVKIGVAAYRFVKSSTPMPKKVRLERSKNAIVAPRVQNFNVDTGEEVTRAEIVRGTKTGGQLIMFEPEELRKVKELSRPGLILLGFKPRNTLKPWFHMKAPYFLYPEERLVKGSRVLFAALHERCLARKVVAICYFTPRQAAKPALVAVEPQLEKLKNNRQIAPPGFLLRYLPYADNIRNLEDQEVKCPHPEPELVTVAESIIDKVKISYNPSMVDNPKVQKYWAGIEALALGYEEARETMDNTLPDEEGMDDRVGDLAEKFMNMAFPNGFDEAAIKKSSKRPGPTRAPAPKKQKLDLDNMTMTDMASQGLVEKLTVDKLKQYLTSEKVSVSRMKKAELVAAVYHHLGAEQP